MKGSKAAEPALYPKNEANKYGVIKDSPRRRERISPHPDRLPRDLARPTPTPVERARLQTMVEDQLDVLNAAYAGDASSAPLASDTPFRFALAAADVNFVTDRLVRASPPARSSGT